MQNGVKLKSVSMTKTFAITLIIIIFLLLFFTISYKLIHNAEQIGINYVNSFTYSAEKVINELQASVQQPVDQQTVQQPAVQNGFMTTMSGVPVVPGFNGVDYDMNVYTAAMANASMPSAFNPIAAANQYMVNPFGAQTVAQQTAAQTTAQQTTQTAVK